MQNDVTLLMHRQHVSIMHDNMIAKCIVVIKISKFVRIQIMKHNNKLSATFESNMEVHTSCTGSFLTFSRLKKEINQVLFYKI